MLSEDRRTALDDDINPYSYAFPNVSIPNGLKFSKFGAEPRDTVGPISAASRLVT